ncbi:MAG: nucleotide exchange factor GrpE [Candidatus Omnitrophica bacterium]|nr:nucleotide exchange factor GrpE [Candidatus Omnitrophota bacterium]MDD5138409.1 nucleotide exchange factor GrpE [Candidatus Omnitrophota bacterium]MDD5537908.1 nucleotide exchange factor GrpE [Candidatus Omnitrophota bacterium]
MNKNGHADDKKNHLPSGTETVKSGKEAQVSGAAPGGDMVTLKREEYEKLKEEAAKAKETWDRFLRQQADFENARKRLERDKQEFQKYAHEDIIVDLLGILDDLERSVEAAERGQENSDAFLKGIEMILAHLYELLKKRGVVVIPAKGKKFDPNQHEALVQTETPDHEDGEVIEEMQKGYRMNDRIIRTAKVRVAKRVEKKNNEKQA